VTYQSKTTETLIWQTS